MYTAWAIWLILDGSDPGPRPFPMPFGGAPNAFITDKEGSATFKRALNFCPWDAAEEGVGENRLIGIGVHLHSDHALYGSIPAPFAGGLLPGTVLHSHLGWNLGAGVPQEIQ